MENQMFCYQCQETAGCSGCTRVGVCGKQPDIAAMQDLLVYVTKGISAVTTTLRQEGVEIQPAVNHMNLFTTITNANFSKEAIIARIQETLSEKDLLLSKLTNKDVLPEAALWNGSVEEFDTKAAAVGVLSTENEDIRSLRELITYGLKGLSAYSKHANVLLQDNEEIEDVNLPVDESIFDLYASEPVEDAVKAFEEIAEQEETADSEEKSLEEQFHAIMAEETASEPVSSVRTAESVEDALKEFGDFIGISEIADSTGSTGSSEDISDDDLEQTSGIFEESTLSDELSETPDEPIDADEKPRTMDFFDLPDEAYTPVQLTEEKHDENVAEVEDLFGNLLMDDEPEVKKTFNDPSEVFSLFDTADGGQDDFDKYSDEKIEEENEKKKTSDTRKYIAQDIADNIASFAQLLEPLNAIKENKIRSKSGILFDWEMRIQALIGDLPIKTYWRNNFRNYEIWSDEKCMEKAGELLSMLELVGIVRDKAKEVVIDKDTLDFYSAQSEHLNNDFHIGETVVVTRPCWKINGHPARKGEIAKKAPFAEFSRKKVSPLETMLRENSCSDGDVNIPVTEDNFCTYDRDIPYVKRAIAEGFCKCAVRRMEDGGALAFFYEVISEGENVHYSPCTLRFEVNIDKNANVVGRFRSEKV